MKRPYWFVLGILALLIGAGCGESGPTMGGNDELTAPDAVERQLTIQSYVYVDENASSWSIESAVKRQIRTAFGPLRVAKISVDDRELKSNVDPSNFQSAEVEVAEKGDDGTVSVVKKVKKVSYTYRARALVHKSKASKNSFDLALLMGNYQSFVDDIIKDCVENYEHDQEFSSSFWYVWAPNEYACKKRIENETKEIDDARQGLGEGQIPKREYERRFLPLSAKLDTVAGPKTTYPEYNRLYALDDASKTEISVYQIMGVASHSDDPEDERYANDMGFKEFLKTVKVLADQWSKLRVASDSDVDPLKLTYDGNSYTATFDQLHDWVVNKSGFPSGISSTEDKNKFRRAIYDHLHLKWVRLEVPITVTAGRVNKQMTVKFNMLYGTESWGVQGYFREAFKNGDVVLYNGHSYIGSGPLDPSNYNPSNFHDRYQILFFNSCVSFNYYGVDYFDLKTGGSQNLDLVTNGIEVWILNGGKSMGQFLVGLFDGKQHTWMKVLKDTQVYTNWTLHDPNRSVDGEQDNLYDPTATPITVEEGWSDAPSVELSSSACGSTVNGTVELAAAADGAERVEFYADGTLLGSDSTDPFSYSWDTTAVADGSVEIKAVAHGARGQTAEASCTTTVQNGGGGSDLFFDDMESGSTNWTATGQWHLAQSSTCASPGYSSGKGAWYFGQDQSCNYEGSGQVKGTLVSRAISGVTASSKLSFRFWREVESSSSGSYDRTSVEVSDDGGSSWKELWSKDSKDASGKAWKSSGELSLAEHAGKSIQIRFSFDSVDDYANDQVGWLIDDVRVTP